MTIVFDLDGTISDPLTGVVASINYALENLGFECKKEADLKKYIGPPLQYIFSELLNSDDGDLIHKAISFFRERYSDVGYRENKLYPGIINALGSIYENGNRLYIATAKKQSIAEAVAEYFSISHYFIGILGCGLNRQKIDLLNEIRRIETGNHHTMIGDRYLDMEAGKSAQFRCVGVLWGYGNEKELIDSGADVLCRRPMDLPRLLKRLS